MDTFIHSTAHCGPNGVLSIEVSLYRTVYCGPNGVLSIEVSLYRTVYCVPNGVLIIEVPLYRTVYCGPNGVLITEVSLCFHTVHSSYQYTIHVSTQYLSMSFRLVHKFCTFSTSVSSASLPCRHQALWQLHSL